MAISPTMERQLIFIEVKRQMVLVIIVVMVVVAV